MDVGAMKSLLDQLHAAAARAGNGVGRSGMDKPEAVSATFGDALAGAIADVSRRQQQAAAGAEAFASGRSDVSLQDVMIDLQKAQLSFQQLVQVRNRVVSAYQDIMNMPV
ncbi:MAG: Flagellar hook-basal body complex protein FliE [Rhodocyclaceae bacterium]|nr:Flagellar hook-basal body complex protein FliE [Rhodocyclaceae bacterium]